MTCPKSWSQALELTRRQQARNFSCWGGMACRWTTNLFNWHWRGWNRETQGRCETVDTHPGRTHFSVGSKSWLRMPRVNHYPLSTSRLSCDPGWSVSPPFAGHLFFPQLSLMLSMLGASVGNRPIDIHFTFTPGPRCLDIDPHVNVNPPFPLRRHPIQNDILVFHTLDSDYGSKC